MIQVTTLSNQLHLAVKNIDQAVSDLPHNPESRAEVRIVVSIYWYFARSRYVVQPSCVYTTGYG